MSKISRAKYADMYGATTKDRIRLADTSLIIEVEKDYATYGDEAKFGGGKSLRDGMGQSCTVPDDKCPDTVITNAVIVDYWGIVKADIGMKDGKICGIGKARVRVHEAINCIRNYSGIWYEEEIVRTFLQLIAVYPVGSKVKTNENELAVVMRQNAHFPERPVLRVIEDKYGQPIKEEKIIDLVKNTSVVIQEVVK